MIKTTPAIPI